MSELAHRQGLMAVIFLFGLASNLRHTWTVSFVGGEKGA